MRGAPLAALLLIACTPAASEPPRAERPSDYVQVIDGDTIRVRGETIRILNIDAPEMPPKSKCWAEAALAVQAKKQTETFVNISPTLQLKREGTDRYGRTLARVVLGDSDLGEALVHVGVASRWTGRRWSWCNPTTFEERGGPSFATGARNGDELYEWTVVEAQGESVTAAPPPDEPSQDQDAR